MLHWAGMWALGLFGMVDSSDFDVVCAQANALILSLTVTVDIETIQYREHINSSTINIE